MASSREYLNYVLEQLSGLEGVTYRAMMGEFILYHRGKIAAYVCDDRLLVKPLPSAVAFLPEAPREPPYEGAKEMILVEDVDDRDFLTALFAAMQEELPEPRTKKKK